MGTFWHSFADMAAVESGGELVIDRGEGAHVWDEQGRRYLDATAALWYCNVGYGREEIADAAHRQMVRLSAYSTFGDQSNRPAIELAERLGGLAPVPDSKVFLTSGGSDSIDTATKMARRYWQLRGETERTLLVARQHAYHGMHVAGTSLAGIEANAAGHGPLVGDVVKIAWDSPAALHDAIVAASPERVAAFFCEPVIGAGGVFAPPEGYLAEVRAICRDAGVLFVADEVITGFGRVGDWFASSRWNLEPDILTCAKGITSGYLPLGATLVSDEITAALEGGGTLAHGFTYTGHPVPCAAALANLDILERERLVERVRDDVGPRFQAALRRFADHPAVAEVRGVQLIGALELRRPSRGPRADAPPNTLGLAAHELAREEGVIVRGIRDLVALAPPFVVTHDELDRMFASLTRALDRL